MRESDMKKDMKARTPSRSDSSMLVLRHRRLPVRRSERPSPSGSSASPPPLWRARLVHIHPGTSGYSIADRSCQVPLPAVTRRRGSATECA